MSYESPLITMIREAGQDCRSTDGYVVSKGGTFGAIERCYMTGDGKEALVIRWGPLRWITPVLEADCKRLRSPYESEAKTEAEAWLRENGDDDVKELLRRGGSLGR